MWPVNCNHEFKFPDDRIRSFFPDTCTLATHLEHQAVQEFLAKQSGSSEVMDKIDELLSDTSSHNQNENCHQESYSLQDCSLLPNVMLGENETSDEAKNK